MDIYTKAYMRGDKYLFSIAGQQIFKNFLEPDSDECAYYVGELTDLEQVIDIDHGTHDKLTIICRSDEELLQLDELVEQIKNTISAQYERKVRLAEIKSKFTEEGMYNILLEIVDESKKDNE